MWEKFDCEHELLYQEETEGIDLSCSIKILAWRKVDDFPEGNYDTVAEVFATLKYGMPYLCVKYYMDDVKKYLHLQKAIQEAKEILQIELDYAMGELYS